MDLKVHLKGRQLWILVILLTQLNSKGRGFGERWKSSQASCFKEPGTQQLSSRVSISGPITYHLLVTISYDLHDCCRQPPAGHNPLRMMQEPEEGHKAELQQVLLTEEEPT